MELFGGQAGYSQDRAKRARGEIAVAMDRNGDYARDAGLPEVVVTTTHMGDLETRSLEGGYDLLTACPGQAGQARETSRSTTSVSGRSAGTGMPSFSAASR